MSILITAILTLHGALGILWVISSAFLTYAILSSGGKLNGKKSVRIGIIMVRAFGGLAIIFGVIVSALLSYYSELPKFYSVTGLVLVAGIALAFLTYVPVNEGMLFRMIRNTEGSDRKKILNLSIISLGLVIIVLLLMLTASL
ncbi:hypothetical protein ApAK_04150 [Thermoplasmatales archaeon AK]|nr:hypothetical protein [Thermoplasmatales archaeon AK]